MKKKIPVETTIHDVTKRFTIVRQWGKKMVDKMEGVFVRRCLLLLLVDLVVFETSLVGSKSLSVQFFFVCLSVDSFFFFCYMFAFLCCCVVVEITRR
jgi:hypothetical protein